MELAYYCNLEVEVVGSSHVSNKIKDICTAMQRRYNKSCESEIVRDKH